MYFSLGAQGDPMGSPWGDHVVPSGPMGRPRVRNYIKMAPNTRTTTTTTSPSPRRFVAIDGFTDAGFRALRLALHAPRVSHVTAVDSSPAAADDSYRFPVWSHRSHNHPADILVLLHDLPALRHQGDPQNARTLGNLRRARPGACNPAR